MAEAGAWSDLFISSQPTGSCSPLPGRHRITGDWVARSRETLQEHKITHVLNCVGFICKEHFKEQLQYKTYYLHGALGAHERCNRVTGTGIDA